LLDYYESREDWIHALLLDLAVVNKLGELMESTVPEYRTVDRVTTVADRVRKHLDSIDWKEAY